ncbi:MAG: GNAT family N-acetyltransferase [Leptolyngbyaceae cyanobacterium SL_7_1]|nr:GNAT family N-acetyltransferase [Leptolyngbyaceae cyanobacterium SL_7_1]
MSSNFKSEGRSLQPFPFLIRTARSQDLNPIVEILVSSFHVSTGWTNWLHPLLRLGIYEDLRHRLRTRSTPYACLVAVALPTIEAPIAQTTLGSPSYSSIAGTVEIGVRHPVWFAPLEQHVYLSNLAIAAPYRRQGVALNLLKHCEKISLEWGYSTLYLHVMEDNTAAHRLYTKAGYDLYRSEPSLSNLFGRPRQILLYKSLK